MINVTVIDKVYFLAEANSSTEDGTEDYNVTSPLIRHKE